MYYRIFAILLFVIGYLSSAVIVHAASLTFAPSSLNATVGQQISTTLSLDPQGDQVIGTDIILTYNPSYVKVISVVNRQTLPGNPATIINNASGTTKFSLINPYGIYTSTPGAIADITLEPIQAGSSQINLVMSPGATNDTNVAIPHGLDSLNSVQSVTLTAHTPTTNTETVTLVVTQTPTPTPKKTTKLPELETTPPGFTKAAKRTNQNLISPVPLENLTPATPSATPTAKPFSHVLGITDPTPPEPNHAAPIHPSYWLALLGIALIAGGLTFYGLSRRHSSQSTSISSSSTPTYSYSIPT